MTAFWIGIGASHIAEVLNSREGNNDRVSSMFIIETGKQATLSGEGYLLDEFKKTGRISQYSGLGTKLFWL